MGTTNTTLNQLLSAIQGGDHDSEAQDILDMHCKRIWEKSGQHTPSKSPRSKSPDHMLNAVSTQDSVSTVTLMIDGSQTLLRAPNFKKIVSLSTVLSSLSVSAIKEKLTYMKPCALV